MGTAVYTLNGRTILTRNALHISALRGPLYSLWKQRQRPGYGVYSSYKDANLGDTTRLPIEGICTSVYTLNGHNILTWNALHIPALQGPL